MLRIHGPHHTAWTFTIPFDGHRLTPLQQAEYSALQTGTAVADGLLSHDVMTSVFYFQNHPTKPHRNWAEVDKADPGMLVNRGDMLMILRSFQGFPHPFPARGDSPAGVPAPSPV